MIKITRAEHRADPERWIHVADTTPVVIVDDEGVARMILCGPGRYPDGVEGELFVEQRAQCTTCSAVKRIGPLHRYRPGCGDGAFCSQCGEHYGADRLGLMLHHYKNDLAAALSEASWAQTQIVALQRLVDV